MSAAASGSAEEGWVADELAAEFPELTLRFLEVPAVYGPSPPSVRDRLAALSDRFRGAHAIVLRREPLPWAYRVFFRHIGLDPDVQRTPMEAVAVRRLIDGAFRSRGTLEDALTLALLEGGVPVWALDAAACQGPLGIRAAHTNERLDGGHRAIALPAGRLVVADAHRPLAVLFGDVDADAAVGAAARRVVLYSVGVAGVPELNVEEALWTCLEVLAAGLAGG